ncbi:TPA: tail fiber assembly protein, partial [Escherichia coli]|nr:tail fiber assembly protein [Escherichia coli]
KLTAWKIYRVQLTRVDASNPQNILPLR